MHWLFSSGWNWLISPDSEWSFLPDANSFAINLLLMLTSKHVRNFNLNRIYYIEQN